MRRSLLVLGVFASVTFPLRSADPPPAPGKDAEGSALVRQLGDESFEARKQAAAKLLALGRAAEGALRNGLKDPDPEVRARCKELLPRVRAADRKARVEAFLADGENTGKHDLPGWPAFSRLAGRDAAARAFYVKVTDAEGDLIEEARQNPKSAAPPLAERANSLIVVLLLPGNEETVLPRLAAVLFLAGEGAGDKPGEGRVPFADPAAGSLHKALEVLPNRASLVKLVEANPPFRRLLFTVLKEDRIRMPEDRAFGVARGLLLKEATPWAAGRAADRKAPAAARAAALLLLARAGDKALLPGIEALLDDTTPAGTRTLGKTTLHAQIRDLALAAAVRINGQKEADYGFPYAEAIPGLKEWPGPGCLGFRNDAERRAALKKWRDRAGKK